MDFKIKNMLPMNIISAIISGVVLFLMPVQALPQGSISIPKGKELFKKHCSFCHGDEAEGQDPSQPAGGWDENNNRLAPGLNGTGHAWHHSPTMMYQYINEGSIDKSSPMPSFKGRINDEEIKSIIAYIQSLWPNEIIDKYNDRFKDTKE